MEQNQYAMDLLTTAKFPSPTGVNYYEFEDKVVLETEDRTEGFRPQQGLTIMNQCSTMWQ